MHNDIDAVIGRLRRLLDTRVTPAVHSAAEPVAMTIWRVPGEPIPFADAVTHDAAGEFAPFAVGDAWGEPWSTYWLRLSATVPDSWQGRTVELVINPGFLSQWPGGEVEGLLFTPDGTPLKAINPQNRAWRLCEQATGGEKLDVYLELAANPDIMRDAWTPTELGDVLTAPTTKTHTFAQADLAVFEPEVWGLRFDLEVLLELAEQLPDNSNRRHQVLRGMERAADEVDLDDIPGSAAAARAVLAPLLAAPASPNAHLLSATGHAHIDSAWLWPVRETIRKTGRTFSNVTALFDDYPEFQFSCSSAQQYEWVREHYPAVWERIEQGVRDGRWFPVGGMWVEADGNLPSGESMTRQLNHGQRFFKQAFGEYCRGVWLPDSFGYTGAYPQIAALAGAQWFLTQKLSWNQTNRLPHHTFFWEGIDGTRLFTHFPPVDTYSSAFTGEQLHRADRNYADKGGGNSSLMPFGHGDGGGGPVRDMMERYRRTRDLEGSPRIVIEPPDEFFARARAEYPNAPVWRGELYLEIHRGVFTSQARTKAGNRRSESLLRQAEFAATAATVHAGAEYPLERLDRLWKLTLLNQFHDILPGSSIAWVHRDAEATYADIEAGAREIIASAYPPADSDGGPAGRVAVWSASPVSARAVVEIGDEQRLVAVPANGFGDGAALTPDHPVHGNEREFGNGIVTVRLADDGTIASLVDERVGRELIAPWHRGNLLQLHPDLPNNWDAWDIDAHYRRRHTDLTDLQSLEVVESSPLRHRVKLVRSHGASTITQYLTLDADSDRIDVDCEIDWQEREKVLKAAFGLDIHAAESAAEIQYGHLRRPTHRNTSWDEARFEIYAHRWIHVGEPGYGAAIANDATYGHDVTTVANPDGGLSTVVRLSLLRAPQFPDPRADLGMHSMRYSLVVGVDVDGAIAAGYALNLPPAVSSAAGVDTVLPPLVSVDGDGVFVEAIKLADDGSGDVIVRVYEGHGGRAQAVLRPGFDVTEATEVNLLEDPIGELRTGVTNADPSAIALSLRPFQIVTLRLRRS